MKYAYVGCRTTKERKARGKGISVYKITDDKWELKQIHGNLINPSYLAFNNTKNYLYVIHGDRSDISSFKINEDGKISYLNTVSTHGLNPVHLSVDKTDKWIFVANLQSGSVAVIERKKDGSLGNVKNLYFIAGNEINTISHPHQVAQDKTGEYLLVSCQARKEGIGKIVVFKINSNNGSLTEMKAVKSRSLAEPRHLVIHDNNEYCYGVNEKDYSITFYKFNEIRGELNPVQILTTLPDTYVGDGWASGICLDNINKFVVVSNRKHDSISSFRIQNDGNLKFCHCVKTDGGQPRFITRDISKNIIWVANEITDNIVGFHINSNGRLEKIGNEVKTESPVCIVFK